MNNWATIILAEDEKSLGLIVKESLETRGFKVLLCHDGDEAYQFYKSFRPDILVLDVMMPKMDGFTLARLIRKTDTETPIIFLTAKSQPHDVVTGFDTGGNDYLKKPFSIEELIVRIQNLLSNARKVFKDDQDIEIGNYSFNPTKQTLQYKQEDIEGLTNRESLLLLQLVQHKNEIVQRSSVLDQLWGNDDFYSTRSMDVFISKLRKKLSKDKSVRILNIRGIGYKLIT